MIERLQYILIINRNRFPQRYFWCENIYREAGSIHKTALLSLGLKVLPLLLFGASSDSDLDSIDWLDN